MVEFPNLRTPPKLRTPTKLSISFTRRSTPRPTPRSSRGGRVKALIDKFNGTNQSSDNSNIIADEKDEGGEDETLIPANDKPRRSFMKSISRSRPDAFMTLDDDAMNAASNDDDIKCTISDCPPPVSESPTVTATKAVKLEKVVETPQEAMSASADDTTSIQSCIPLSFTTSSVEHIDVKTLPYEFDDEDKENNHSVKEARGLNRNSQIDTPSPSTTPSPLVGDTNANSICTTTNVTNVLQEKHVVHHREQQSNISEKSSSTATRNRKLHRHEQNSKSKFDLKDMIEPNSEASNRTIRDTAENYNEVNESRSDKAIGNSKYSKFRTSKINAIKMSSRKFSPTRSKPPLYQQHEVQDMEAEVVVPIAQSFSSPGWCVGINFSKHCSGRSQSSDDIDGLNSLSIDDDHGLGTKSLSINEHDIVANETMHNDMVAAISGDNIMIVHASTDKHDTDKIQNYSRGPSRSESPFHQQARVAMTAAGIESRSSSKPTDIYGFDHKSPRQSNTNNQNDTGTDDDILVMVSKGSESETIEITKTRSMIQHQPQGKKKSKQGRESPFHEMARNAMAAAAVAEERKHNPHYDVPVVDGIVEVTTVTSIDDTDANAVEKRDDDDVEEEIFLEEIGSNVNLPPPADPVTECPIIVSASSSASSRMEQALPTPALDAIPIQPPKFDNVQLLTPYLVNYGFTQSAPPIPYYQYTYPCQYVMHPPPPPFPPQPMQYYAYHPPPSTTSSEDGNTIYIRI